MSGSLDQMKFPPLSLGRVSPSQIAKFFGYLEKPLTGQRILIDAAQPQNADSENPVFYFRKGQISWLFDKETGFLSSRAITPPDATGVMAAGIIESVSA